MLAPSVETSESAIAEVPRPDPNSDKKLGFAEPDDLFLFAAWNEGLEAAMVRRNTRWIPSSDSGIQPYNPVRGRYVECDSDCRGRGRKVDFGRQRKDRSHGFYIENWR